nr:cobalt-precorrin-5B (C(1))-methyltransferase CbiD [Fundidesulfovibrio terrae]
MRPEGTPVKKHRETPCLRQGFTTGSAAAAAAKAALEFLLTGRKKAHVDIPLPTGGRLQVAVASVGFLDEGRARAVVVKDAGDDPDATNRARIACLAELVPGEPGAVALEGGRGVGRVTRPGLPVPVGQAAINPAPRAQIVQAAREAMHAAGHSGAASLVIEVEDGEAMAARTLNPRLGILGGISILGTQGIVKPFSLDAWKATIDSGLEVARASGADTAAFATGRRSERMLMELLPELPEVCFVQAADFFAYSIERAARLGFAGIVWGCYFGKLVKMAQGLAYTHAHEAPTDFEALARLAGRAGADEHVCREVAGANTARHALEIVPEGAVRRRFAALTAQGAVAAARSFAKDGPRLRICCFGFEGGLLAEAYSS